MNGEEAAAAYGLIIDRTEQDVAYARSLLHKGLLNMTDEEKEIFLAGPLKGTYNAVDLSRVDDWVWEIYNVLNHFGYPVIIDRWPQWGGYYSVPLVEEMDIFLLNVKIIRKAFATFVTTPAVPDSMKFFTYKQANDVERVLCDIIALIENMSASFNYSGDLYGGEM